MRAEWTLFQTHCYTENLVSPEIEPGTIMRQQKITINAKATQLINREVWPKRKQRIKKRTYNFEVQF
jgi:hypothetical protein